MLAKRTQLIPEHKNRTLTVGIGTGIVEQDIDLVAEFLSNSVEGLPDRCCITGISWHTYC